MWSILSAVFKKRTLPRSLVSPTGQEIHPPDRTLRDKLLRFIENLPEDVKPRQVILNTLTLLSKSAGRTRLVVACLILAAAVGWPLVSFYAALSHKLSEHVVQVVVNWLFPERPKSETAKTEPPKPDVPKQNPADTPVTVPPSATMPILGFESSSSRPSAHELLCELKMKAIESANGLLTFYVRTPDAYALGKWKIMNTADERDGMGIVVDRLDVTADRWMVRLMAKDQVLVVRYTVKIVGMPAPSDAPFRLEPVDPTRRILFKPIPRASGSQLYDSIGAQKYLACAANACGVRQTEMPALPDDMQNPVIKTAAYDNRQEHSDGNVYVTDSLGHRVKKISPSSVVSTLAGNVYTADPDNNRLRVVLNSRASYEVMPSALYFSGQAQGSALPELAIMIVSSTNGLAFTTAVSTTSGGDWLSVTPDEGSMPAALRVHADQARLGPGNYNGTITITAPSAGAPVKTVSVKFTVASSRPSLAIETRSLSFSVAKGSGAASAQLQVSSQGGTPLAFAAAAATVSGCDWLNISPATANAAASAPATVTVVVDVSKLDVGTYTGSIIFASQVPGDTIVIPVSVTVRSLSQMIQLSQTGMTFMADTGGSTPLPQSFGVLNLGSDVMTWALQTSTLSGGQGWLKVTPAGDPANGTVLYAPNSTVNISGGSDWHGAMVVGNLDDSGGVAIHYDRSLATAPTIAASVSPVPNAAGWNNSNVTVTFTCADPVGIASCSAPVQLTNEDANQVVTGSAVNLVGLSSTTSVTVNIDKTPPLVAEATSPLPNAAGWNNSNVAVTFTCSDMTSGIAFCPAPISITTEGAKEVVSGTATDKAGNTTTSALTLNIDKTSPTTSALTPAPSANGWNNSNVTVSITWSDALSGVASCSPPTSVLTEGQIPVSGKAVDVAGNTTTTSVTVDLDKTAPTITASVSPLPNAVGWNNSSVTVTFNCSDAGSGIDVCPSPVQVSTDGAGQVISGTARDKAGNTATASVTVNLDRIAPTITATVVPAPNAAGWNNAGVTVNFASSDTGSGIADCQPPVQVTAEGANQVISGTAQDKAGNSATASVIVNVDKTALTLTITSPTNGAVLPLPSATITGTATDGLSGIASVTCQGSTATILGANLTCVVPIVAGLNTIGVVAPDVTGNIAQASLSVQGSVPTIMSIAPNAAQQGQSNLSVTITGQYTHFVQRTTTADFGTGITVNSVSVAGARSMTAQITIAANATLGPRTVTVTMGTEAPSLPGGFIFTPATNQAPVVSAGANRTITLSSVGVQFTEYPVPTSLPGPQSITTGPDGNLWFAEQSAHKIGRITTAGVFTEFSVPSVSDLQDIALGPDGNLWFTEYFGNKIWRMTTAGVLTPFPIPTDNSEPYGITAGPDGNLWFTERTANKIGRITPTGVFTEFSLPTSASNPFEIVAGPDGNLWFAEGFAANSSIYGDGKIGRITTTGVITEFPIPTTHSIPYGITSGPDGNLWFTEGLGGKIGRITTAGAITEFPIPTTNSIPYVITTGPDGNLWFAEEFAGYSGGRIGRITTAGVITEYPVPTSASLPVAITAGPDGNLWFTEAVANNIGRANFGAFPTPTTTTLTGSLTDDGLPAGARLTTTWSETSGPGPVSFNNPTATFPDVAGQANPVTTSATFSVPGTYVLGLTASDSLLSSSSSVTITVNQPQVPTILSVSPNAGQQSQQNLSVNITGQFTHFVQGATTADFGVGITVVSLTMNTATAATAVLNIDPTAVVDPRRVTLTNGIEMATLGNGIALTAGTPVITLVNPNTGQQGQQNLSVAVTGRFTNFVQGASQASFGAGITVTLDPSAATAFKYTYDALGNLTAVTDDNGRSTTFHYGAAGHNVFDLLGNPAEWGYDSPATLDASKSLRHLSYDPTGNPASRSNRRSPASIATGFYHLTARYYNAAVGRFITVEPLSVDVADDGGTHLQISGRVISTRPSEASLPEPQPLTVEIANDGGTKLQVTSKILSSPRTTTRHRPREHPLERMFIMYPSARPPHRAPVLYGIHSRRRPPFRREDRYPCAIAFWTQTASPLTRWGTAQLKPTRSARAKVRSSGKEP